MHLSLDAVYQQTPWTELVRKSWSGGGYKKRSGMAVQHIRSPPTIRLKIWTQPTRMHLVRTRSENIIVINFTNEINLPQSLLICLQMCAFFKPSLGILDGQDSRYRTMSHLCRSLSTHSSFSSPSKPRYCAVFFTRVKLFRR